MVAIDKGIIKAKRQRRGEAGFRRIGAPELRYLAIAGLVEKDLTPAARTRVYDAIRRFSATEHRLDLGVMELTLAEIDQRIPERLTRLAAIKAHVGCARRSRRVGRGQRHGDA